MERLAGTGEKRPTAVAMPRGPVLDSKGGAVTEARGCCCNAVAKPRLKKVILLLGTSDSRL
jgi:hypothetical protein